MARKNSTKKEKAMRIPKISWMVKPEGMTLVRWQQALRQQIAREEVMVGEKVKLWISEQRRHKVHTEVPAYTSVYLSYVEGRQVKIRVGSDHREEFMQLAQHYFDAEGIMFPYAFDDYDKFIVQAKSIDPTFRFYQDAIAFILEQREQKYRSQVIRRYTDERPSAPCSI